MKQLTQIFWVGAVISFLGSLPLGVLNITATQLSVENGISAAFVFATGAMIVELIYVFIILRAMNWVSKRMKLFRFFEWITTILILALSINTLIAAVNMQKISSIVPQKHRMLF
jgi:threonine/homoserine/homoserine lactone efflux protein